MERNLLAVINEAFADDDQVPEADIDRIVNDVPSALDPMDYDLSCHLANLQICAVEKYKLSIGIGDDWRICQSCCRPVKATASLYCVDHTKH